MSLAQWVAVLMWIAKVVVAELLKAGVQGVLRTRRKAIEKRTKR